MSSKFESVPIPFWPSFVHVKGETFNSSKENGSLVSWYFYGFCTLSNSHNLPLSLSLSLSLFLSLTHTPTHTHFHLYLHLFFSIFSSFLFSRWFYSPWPNYHLPSPQLAQPISHPHRHPPLTNKVICCSVFCCMFRAFVMNQNKASG